MMMKNEEQLKQKTPIENKNNFSTFDNSNLIEYFIDVVKQISKLAEELSKINNKYSNLSAQYIDIIKEIMSRLERGKINITEYESEETKILRSIESGIHELQEFIQGNGEPPTEGSVSGDSL
jgi:hypothetical protein